MTDAFFRAGVGALVLNSSRKALVMKRKGFAGQGWQMPQGGIRVNETPIEALHRELEEETGLGEVDIRVVSSTSEWLAYELPAKYRNPKVGWGQVQRWYLCHLTQNAEHQVAPDRIEFDALDWVTPTQLVERAIDFRQKLYLRVLNEFGLLKA